MIKTITKIGNSYGIILDAALMERTRLNIGDRLNIELHTGGTITLTPIRPSIKPPKAAATAKRLMSKNKELFRRLA